jgi:hypothetical protein
VNNLEITPSCTVVTGSSGRVGRALRCVWGDRVAGRPVVWSARRADQPTDFVWDIGKSDPPPFPDGAIFLHLAGQIRGDAAALAENRRSAQVLCKVAEMSQAAHVFLMSSGAVYAASAGPIFETQDPAPFSDYGRAKLEAEQVAQSILPPDRLTILRLGNLAGADALLSAARMGPVVLDPIEGQPGGPERSYIGPRALPAILNIGQPPALAMADLLQAYGADWSFGPPRKAAVPRVELCVDLLAGLIDVPQASARTVVDDLASLDGQWP